MAGGVVYHWKHGWIPLDHVAALSKAKGNHERAAKYMAAAHEAKGIHSRQDLAKAILDLPNVTDPTHRAQAKASIDEAAHRLGAQDLLPGSGKPTPGPADAREAFRMGGPELRQHAANGSPVAQAELDRRAAKHGKPSAPTVTKAPATPAAAEQAKSLTPAELHAQNKGDLKIGDEVTVKSDGRNRLGTVTAFDESGRAHVTIAGYGTVIRSAPDVSKDIHPSTRAAAQRSVLGDFRNTPTIQLQHGLTSQTVHPSQKEAYRAELRRRGITPIDETSAIPAVADRSAENAAIAPAGHTIESKAIGTRNDGTTQFIHTQRTAAGERIGSVIDSRTGGYQARYDGKVIGSFTSRQEAHQALADAHQATVDAARAKLDALARKHANAKPIGIFQPRTPQGDGTKRGDAAATKIKQSFTVNDHTVNIETAMTKDQTKALLDDIHAVLLKSGHLDGQGITFHVPSGDTHFRQKRGRLTGGYVRQGQRTIFINPKVANGAIEDSFGGPGTVGDHFMPAANKTNGRQYTLTHELGHVIDAQHGHTRETDSFTALGQQMTTRHGRADATALQREQSRHLSGYGSTNPQEGYAEAYAQWIHGGPGSNPAADAFAARYGWVVPKWYREGIRR